MIGYSCKYAPIEVFAGFGRAIEMIDPQEKSFDVAESHTYASICSFSKAIFQHILLNPYDEVVFMDCCDGMKTAQDLLARQGQHVFSVSVPRFTDGPAVSLFAQSVLQLIGECEKRYNTPFDCEAFLAACKGHATRDEGDYYAIVGARAPRALFEESRRLCSLEVRDLTCARYDRVFFDVPACATKEAAVTWYAGQLLGQVPCMRMPDHTARASIFEDPHLKGIIYHTVKFCEFYSFEYASLPEDTYALKLETDFTPASAGQMKTRLQAFFEGGDALEGDVAAKEDCMHDGGNTGYYAGIDIGSASTNVVILDKDTRIVSHVVIPTGAKSGSAADAAMGQALGKAGLCQGDLTRIVATGYGRGSVSFEAGNVTEISCHARGVAHEFPAAGAIIDIGGQDSKVIRLDGAGSVVDFAMNDKCAAGTGRFLELMADTLKTDLAGISDLGATWEEDISISSMCAVFAESEVISLIAENKEQGDIVRGINLSIAGRVASMVNRQHAKGPFVMTGGVAKNRGVVLALEEKIGQPILVPEEPQLCGALGAALFAADG